MAYYQLEPWGPERDSWHAAQITTAIFQVWTKRRLRIEANLLKFGESSKPKSLVNKLRGIAMALGATKDDGSNKPQGKPKGVNRRDEASKSNSSSARKGQTKGGAS